MSEQLGPGSTFAGCRLESVAGRGGMGVVFRATQLALQRPVALKAITPEFAADEEYRHRFQRESHLAASLDHPNVIPVYEAGEFDGTLYLIMRWVEGTDLRTLLAKSGRLSAGRAIRLLRPVASALAAAHRRGLVHRDIKPANVLIARGDEEADDHIYLTDFGIARHTDGASLTRTGLFVGTIEYAAPERIEGRRGGGSSDIYSFGCMLFEAVTGHVPFDRPTYISRLFAHINDPVPSVREEVEGIPRQLDAIIAKAMAKRPEHRVESASEFVVVLGRVLQDIETAERQTAAPRQRPDETNDRVPPIATEPAAEVTRPRAEPTGPVVDPGWPAAEQTAPAAARTGEMTQPTAPAAARSEEMTQPTAPSPVPTIPVDDRSPAAPRRPRAWIGWVLAIALLAAAGGLGVALLGNGDHAGSTGVASNPGVSTGVASNPVVSPAATKVVIGGSGLAEARSIGLSSPPRSISVGGQSVWVSLPDRGQVVRWDPATGTQRNLATGGSPTAIAAGSNALWVAEPASRSLVQLNGDSGARVAVATLAGTPTAVAVDQNDSSAWVADSSGAITHVAVGGAVIGTPAHSDPAATNLGLGEGWLWATNAADHGLIRVSLSTNGSSTTFSTNPGPVAVTLDQGVWTAHSNGHVTRFDPRFQALRVNSDLAVSSELDAIAATEGGPFVWAISKSAKTLFRITNTSVPAVTGTVVFGSTPVALAVNGRSVWVGTDDGRVTEIRF